MTHACIIGHRGVASLAPENTLAGLRMAADIGLRWVEIDATLLADGTLVLSHDHTLKRCTNGRGRLSHHNYDSIARLDAGSWFSDAFIGEPIPTLEQALMAVQALDLNLNLELKQHKACPDRMVSQLAAQLRQHWQRRDLTLLISAFEHPLLLRLRQAMPEIAIGQLYGRVPMRRWRKELAALNATSLHMDWRYLRWQLAEEIKNAGYQLYCYTCNDPRQAQLLAEWGVDGIITDRPQDFIPQPCTGQSAGHPLPPLPQPDPETQTPA